MMIPGVDTTWEVLQFHIHTSSEHAIDGHLFGAEMHIVHKDVNSDNLAVVGYFLEPSLTDPVSFNDLLSEWETQYLGVLSTCQLGNMPISEYSNDPSTVFGVYDLIPPKATIYTYQGSLTTPPCSEIVSWNVVDTPVQLSPRDFNRVIQLVLGYVNPETCELGSVANDQGSTSRPLRPVNGRTITRHCPVGFVEESSANPNEAGSSGAALPLLSYAAIVGGLAMLM
jgi:carbonic anhydrase